MREGIVRVLLKDSHQGITMDKILRIVIFARIHMKEIIVHGKPRIHKREKVTACTFFCPGPGLFMRKMKDVPEHDRPREKIAKKV